MAGDKKILLVSYYFPPLGMAGIGRPYALFRFLPEFGYDVYVLTTRKILYPAYDHSLLSPDDEKRIFRTGSLDPSRVLYKFGLRRQSSSGFASITGRLPVYLPDLKRGWNSFATKKAKKTIRAENITTVITTSPPPSSHMIGLAMKKELDIKWIADFRDFWFPLPIEEVYRSKMTRKYALGLRDRIIARSDEVVTVNNSIRDYLGRGRVIFNGVEPDAASLWAEGNSASDRRLSIGLMGTFNYAVPLKYLLEAIAILLDRGSVARKDIEVVHVGHADPGMKSTVDQLGFGDLFRFRGYHSRREAVRLLRRCRMLYLAVTRFDRFHILPSRIFDLIVSGKPLLLLAPSDSDAARFVRDYPCGHLVTDYDPAKVAAVIKKIHDSEGNASLDEDQRKKLVEKYSMRRLAREYAGIIGNISRPD